MNLRNITNDDHDLGLNLSLELKCSSHILSPKHKPSLNVITFQSSSASSPNSFQGADMNNELLEVEPLPLSTMSPSPDSIITSGNGKRSERDEFGSERQSTNSEDGGGNDSSARKKLRLTKEQAMVLEETFKHQCTLSQNQKVALAQQLKLQTRQVEVWFQNRRARTKFKNTEKDYMFLKRRCEDLENENHRLQKEIAELRAMKCSPLMKPPSTLSLSPRCEHMAYKVPISSPVTNTTPASATGTSTQRHVNPSDQKAPSGSNWFINQLRGSRPCE